MFNLFRDFDQELTQNAKLQHLFQKINCNGLSNCIAALEFQHNLNDLLFDQAIDHIATLLYKSQNNTKFSQVSSAGSSLIDSIANILVVADEEETVENVEVQFVEFQFVVEEEVAVVEENGWNPIFRPKCLRKTVIGIKIRQHL